MVIANGPAPAPAAAAVVAKQAAKREVEPPRKVLPPAQKRSRSAENLHLISSILLGLLLRHREAEHARFHR
jgi:hypothetical protein